MARARPFIPCSEKCLPPGEAVAAATRAASENPSNAPPPGALAALFGAALVGDMVDKPGFIAVLTSKYWGPKGRAFGVSFLDNPTAGCRSKILAHMNAWNERCNLSFRESSQGEIRIARGNSGYWSYLGTDILSIPAGQATMNLQGFTENTSESEYRRVVRHETGHACGCPHEHMRAAIVGRLDPAKTIAYFRQTQGWSEEQTRQQVLTPLSEGSSVMGSPTTDDDSIMCYSLPGSITRDGRPIVGGSDVTAGDAAFMAKLYPKPDAPAPPAGESVTLAVATATVVKALTDLGFKVSK